MQYYIKDYDFQFQTKGVFFFFTDICGQFYCWPNSLIYSLHGEYKQFTHINNREYAEELYKKLYKDRSSVEAFCRDFEIARDEMFALKSKLESVDQLAVEDFDAFVDQTRRMQKAYSSMEPMLTDKLFSDESGTAKELVDLVLTKKNVYREEFNQLFFNDTSCLMRIFKLGSKMIGIPVEDLSYLSIGDFREVLLGKPFEDHYKGSKDYVLINDAGNFIYYYGADARSFITEFIHDSKSESVNELKGKSVAKKGVYRGPVKKVLVDYNDLEGSLRAMDRGESGYVLVTDSTVPEMLSLMSRSLAIVTNVGGLLSHAAITSRELNIPCVVGTVRATEVLNDGDMVEVDADNGIIRIFK